MKKTILSFLVVGATFAAIVACSSGGSSGGSGGSISSVDSSKSLNNLSDSEAKQYCDDLLAYNDSQLSEEDLKKYTCGFTAQVVAGFGAKDDAEAQAKCKTELEKCLARPTTTPDAGSTSDQCETFKQRLASCNATVSEMNQCTSESVTQLKTQASQDFCANAKADGGIGALLQQPQSCISLQQKCPGLFGGVPSTPDGG